MFGLKSRKQKKADKDLAWAFEQIRNAESVKFDAFGNPMPSQAEAAKKERPIYVKQEMVPVYYPEYHIGVYFASVKDDNGVINEEKFNAWRKKLGLENSKYCFRDVQGKYDEKQIEDHPVEFAVCYDDPEVAEKARKRIYDDRRYNTDTYYRKDGVLYVTDDSHENGLRHIDSHFKHFNDEMIFKERGWHPECLKARFHEKEWFAEHGILNYNEAWNNIYNNFDENEPDFKKQVHLYEHLDPLIFDLWNSLQKGHYTTLEEVKPDWYSFSYRDYWGHEFSEKYRDKKDKTVQVDELTAAEAEQIRQYAEQLKAKREQGNT